MYLLPRGYILATLLILAQFWPVAAHALQIHSLAYGLGEKQETIVITLSEKVGYKLFLIDRPDRLVLDLPSTLYPDRKNALKDYQGNLIKGVRFGQYTEERSRLVFDLKSHPVSLSATMMPDQGGGVRIEITLASKGLPDKAALSPRQPEKPMIVIDAGHGGQDPGAVGPRGTEEKTLTLSVARKLRNALLETGRFRATLTRDDDRFILLRDRVQIARKQGARMFISLHVNTAPVSSARGLSIYTLSDKASDEEAGLLAARENKADLIAGMDLNGASEDVANILIDLAQRETNTKSTRLSDLLVRAAGHQVELLQNTRRSAGFAVLKAPDIPSVLVEMGFLTNPREERLLNSDAYQARIAKGLAEGIDSYFKALKTKNPA